MDLFFVQEAFMSAYPEYSQVPPPAIAQTSTLAIISLVGGILSWTLAPVIGGIVAVVTGHMAKGEIRRSGGMLTGDGLATAGMILGYIHLGLAVIGFCLAILAFAGLVTLPFCFIPFANNIH
jgi:hypothetical protein